MNIPYLLDDRNYVSSASVAQPVFNTRSSVNLVTTESRVKMNNGMYVYREEIILTWDKWGRLSGERKLVLGLEG